MHSHDMTSICIIKLCDHSIYKLLEMIFKSFFNQGIFSSEWKKVNVVSVSHAESGSLICEKLQTSFSFPVFSKIFERLIYNAMYKHFIGNSLISSNQSSFKLGDSCINHIIIITHDIFKGFGNGWEGRGAFLDKVWQSMTFDKV